MKHDVPLIDRLLIVGVGLIGGSLARALKQAGMVGRVLGLSRTDRSIEAALELGVIDEAASDLGAAAAEADVIVLATPVRTMTRLWPQLNNALSDTAIVTDVGSVKGRVVDDARVALGSACARFVPAHPIAGTENSGVEASFAELFVDKQVILTPLEDNDPRAVDVVERMWTVCGARVSSMAVAEHDRLLAATSHLPHVVAYALVDYLASRPEAQELFELAAGGFYDFTRIASSDPTMWRDICLTNAAPLADVVRGFKDRLDILLGAIEGGDGGALEACFQRSKSARDAGLIKKGGKRDDG